MAVDPPARLPLAARCLLPFLAGSFEGWHEANGSEPPPDVLARILARYPGDPGEVAAACELERRDGWL